MHRSIQVALALLWCGCADSEPRTERDENPIGIAVTSSDESDLIGSPRLDRFRPCASDSEQQCLEDEQCVRGSVELFSICLAACNDVNDCTASSEALSGQSTPGVTCSEFEGAKRCVMGCASAAECPSAMSCMQGVCVFP